VAAATENGFAPCGLSKGAAVGFVTAAALVNGLKEASYEEMKSKMTYFLMEMFYSQPNKTMKFNGGRLLCFTG
jgi:hypothetical protein